MNKVVLLIVGTAVLSVGAAISAFATGSFGHSAVKPLVGDDVGRMRHEALALFPRGLPIAQVTDGLKAMGFLCTPVHRVSANVNAPSVECDSAGRGYPTSPRTEVTVMARNGTLSDIAIGNGVDAVVADARTPNPGPSGIIR